MKNYSVGDMLPTIYGNGNKILSVEFDAAGNIRGYWVEFYNWLPGYKDNKVIFISPDEIKFDGIKSR